MKEKGEGGPFGKEPHLPIGQPPTSLEAGPTMRNISGSIIWSISMSDKLLSPMRWTKGGQQGDTMLSAFMSRGQQFGSPAFISSEKIFHPFYHTWWNSHLLISAVLSAQTHCDHCSTFGSLHAVTRLNSSKAILHLIQITLGEGTKTPVHPRTQADNLKLTLFFFWIFPNTLCRFAVLCSVFHI